VRTDGFSAVARDRATGYNPGRYPGAAGRTERAASAGEGSRPESTGAESRQQEETINNNTVGAGSRTRSGPWLRRIGWALLVIVLIVGADQITKLAAKRYLRGQGTISVVGDVLVFHYVQNQGAFLSLGSRWSDTSRFLIFTVATSAAVVALSGYLFAARALAGTHRIALACIIGGGIGNLIDRIAYKGLVIDFLNLGVGRLRTGIFNTADLAVLVGALVLLLAPLRKGPGDGERVASKELER
jgi:signal peptidase II